MASKFNKVNINERKLKMEDKTVEIKVGFTEQQLEVLDNIKEEKIFGENYEDIALNMFRNYLKQNFGEKGA
jgi:hypothetical protein